MATTAKSLEDKRCSSCNAYTAHELRAEAKRRRKQGLCESCGRPLDVLLLSQADALVGCRRCEGQPYLVRRGSAAYKLAQMRGETRRAP